eukprot:CAMPEP_0170168050 /NCGR_PEP_ID=MMETSP0040_2-20121228/1247_1 /TAXON_ID=641309 /ORGANISM="Lotharella oceanica, Strain CCMP622" /LENGTH=42 /DNA_ID= /DNA_START= /DNA_END= /DNA_ORIENTATION=
MKLSSKDPASTAFDEYSFIQGELDEVQRLLDRLGSRLRLGHR